MRTQNTKTGAGNTTAARTFNRNYYEVQHRGLHEDSCDRWFLSRRCKTLDEARQFMADARKQYEKDSAFLYVGPNPDRRIIHVDAVCTIID